MKRRRAYRNPQVSTDSAMRARVAQRQPQIAPYPMAQAACQPYIMPNLSGYQVVGNGMPMGLPKYTAIDEYGRVYTPNMVYGPQTNAAPVPIAKPAEIVQLTPIVSPVAYVPYSTQNQPLYTYTDDDNNR